MFDRAHRTLAHVPRWAILRVNRRQSVAEHSYFVAVYAVEIARAIEWTGDIGRLVTMALVHDVDEIVTSDVPSPVKRHTKDVDYGWLQDTLSQRLSATSLWWDYATRTPEERAIVKLADIVESLLYLADERAQGNKNTGPMHHYMDKQLQTFWDETFLPTFRIDSNYLGKGQRLLSTIHDAIEKASNSVDPVVA